MTWRLAFAITLTLLIVLTLMMSLSHNVVWLIMSHVDTKCWVCQQEDMDAFDFKPKACTCNRSDLVAGDGISPRQTRISCVSEIRIGDHIAWHQRMGYWHHAIVTEINGTELRVLHYNGPNLPNKGIVMEEWMPADVESELYRINYRPEVCDDPKVVIERGRSRLGECEYNILTNNCEHFARWCKTGNHRSMQSEFFVGQFAQRAYMLAGSSLVSATKWLFSTPQGKAALNFASTAVSVDALKIAAQEVAAKEVTPLVALAQFVTAPALMVFHELQTVYREIRQAYQQRSDGHITQREFIKITVQWAAEGCGIIAGVAIALAILFTRNPIGCTVASVIGHGLGAIAGRGLGCLCGGGF